MLQGCSREGVNSRPQENPEAKQGVHHYESHAKGTEPEGLQEHNTLPTGGQPVWKMPLVSAFTRLLLPDCTRQASFVHVQYKQGAC